MQILHIFRTEQKGTITRLIECSYYRTYNLHFLRFTILTLVVAIILKLLLCFQYLCHKVSMLLFCVRCRWWRQWLENHLCYGQFTLYEQSHSSQDLVSVHCA